MLDSSTAIRHKDHPFLSGFDFGVARLVPQKGSGL